MARAATGEVGAGSRAQMWADDFVGAYGHERLKGAFHRACECARSTAREHDGQVSAKTRMWAGERVP